jgi:hypothetical protein
MTASWSIELDLDLGRPGTDHEASAIEIELDVESVAVSGSGHGLIVNAWHEAPDWEGAAEYASKLGERVAEPFGGFISEARIRTEQRVDEELASPTLPTLVGASEVGHILGISRQRVHQLHRDNAAFPAPLVQVAMGPLWDAQAIDKFARGWTRKPGRPSAHNAA